MSEYNERQIETIDNKQAPVNSEPIEPERTILTKSWIFKFVVIVFVLIYALISYLHVPLLTFLGEYLIVDHNAEKSDLIVCLAGENIERGLATADAFKMGLAPYVLVTRESLPDGYELLRAQGIEYPESIDLMIMLLKSLGVPDRAILTSEKRALSTFEEAGIVKELVNERGFKSIIVLTSPPHTRRAWLTYKEVFKDTGVHILMKASMYSGFTPKTWWKERKYIRNVILEYQKIIFYLISYLI